MKPWSLETRGFIAESVAHSRFRWIALLSFYTFSIFAIFFPLFFFSLSILCLSLFFSTARVYRKLNKSRVFCCNCRAASAARRFSSFIRAPSGVNTPGVCFNVAAICDSGRMFARTFVKDALFYDQERGEIALRSLRETRNLLESVNNRYSWLKQRGEKFWRIYIGQL